MNKTISKGGKRALFRDLWHRCQVRKAVQTPNATGGINTTFEIVSTIWCNLIPLDMKSGIYMRDVQTGEMPTHKIIMRNSPALQVTRYHLKSNCYLHIQEGDSKGREFKIMSVTEIDERSNYLEIMAMERRTVFGTDGLT